MQYLKDDIRNNILNSALKEFLEKGFVGASMRDIAKNAGVALGNVYRYFKSKDDLFNEITDPVHNELLKLVFYVAKESDIDDKNLPIIKIVDSVMKVYEMYSKELIIIIEKSEGSKYHNVKSDLIMHLNKRLSEDLLAKLKENNDKVDAFFINVISTTLLEGLFIILREYKDKKKIQNNIALLLKFYFNNIVERLKSN